MSAGTAEWVDVGWLALGGGVGAVLRYLVDVAVTSRWRRQFPLATLLINVSGAFLLGVVVALVAEVGPAVGAVAPLVATGVLGGYTTFSTASHDTIRLARDGRLPTALAYAVGTMVASVLAVFAGLWLGGLT